VQMYGRSFEDLDGNIWEVMWMSEEMASAEMEVEGACGEKAEGKTEG
jgi:hypothetical protein